MYDTTENHKKGFCISNTGRGDEVQRIDEPETWEIENEYTFKIPKLSGDAEAKELAVEAGYLFKNPNNPYEVTGFVN